MHELFPPDDIDGTIDLGGQPLHHSMRGNLNVSHPIQQDRIGYARLDGISSATYRSLIGKTIAESRRAVMAHSSHRNGGSTMSVVMYDPKTFTVELGQVGDSPVFLLGETKDGRSFRLELTEHPHNNETIPFTIADTAHATWHALDRTRPEAERRARPGNIDLAMMAKRLAAKLSVPREELKLSLLAISDGSVEASPDSSGQSKLLVAPKADEHASDFLDNIMLTNRSHDNLSALLLPDIQPAKGEPVALLVCDGHADLGHDVAEAAGEAAIAFLARERATSQQKPR